MRVCVCVCPQACKQPCISPPTTLITPLHPQPPLTDARCSLGERLLGICLGLRLLLKRLVGFHFLLNPPSCHQQSRLEKEEGDGWNRDGGKRRGSDRGVRRGGSKKSGRGEARFEREEEGRLLRNGEAPGGSSLAVNWPRAVQSEECSYIIATVFSSREKLNLKYPKMSATRNSRSQHTNHINATHTLHTHTQVSHLVLDGRVGNPVLDLVAEPLQLLHFLLQLGLQAEQAKYGREWLSTAST